MDLHGLVKGAIGVVNPLEVVAVSYSEGNDIAGDGTQTPIYQTVPRDAQVQALTYRDLLQVSSMNIQGTRRRMYFEGEVDGIVRMLNKGGDTITRSDGTVWLVAYVLEQWPDWCAVCVTLQNGA
jgi:hypothetical protein